MKDFFEKNAFEIHYDILLSLLTDKKHENTLSNIHITKYVYFFNVNFLITQKQNIRIFG